MLCVKIILLFVALFMLFVLICIMAVVVACRMSKSKWGE